MKTAHPLRKSMYGSSSVLQGDGRIPRCTPEAIADLQEMKTHIGKILHNAKAASRIIEAEESESQWEYLLLFLKLLVMYGGGTRFYKYAPIITEKINFDQIDQFYVRLFLCEDGYHREGRLFNPDGECICVF